jgi:hypothetical protein
MAITDLLIALRLVLAITSVDGRPRMLLNVERAILLFVDKQEITMTTKAKLPSYMLGLAAVLAVVAVTTATEAHEPGCIKWVRGCYHPLGNIGDHPGNRRNFSLRRRLL